MTEQSMIDYRARCHCGRVRFSFKSPEITTGCHCDCSLCQRRGPVLSSRYIPREDFIPHANPDDVGVYLWNEKVLHNTFCKTCGIFTYIADGEDARDGYRVNLGCVEGLDVFALEISRIDGSRCRWWRGTERRRITRRNPSAPSICGAPPRARGQATAHAAV